MGLCPGEVMTGSQKPLNAFPQGTMEGQNTGAVTLKNGMQLLSSLLLLLLLDPCRGLSLGISVSICIPAQMGWHVPSWKQWILWALIQALEEPPYLQP